MNRTNTKEEIILATLQLGMEKGLNCVSISDISMAVGIRKSSIYSHFESQQAIIDAVINYCQDILEKKNFIVDFKAKDPQSLLVSLVNSFLDCFGEAPLSLYWASVQQLRLVDDRFAQIWEKLSFMITARIRVALEYCVQRTWLDIPDTDIASDFFSCAVSECLTNLIAEDKKTPGRKDTDWELDRLVDGLLVLFG